MSNPVVKCDLTQFDKQPEKLAGINTAGQSFSYHFDGIAVYGINPQSPEYKQVFRDGAIEAVWTQYLLPSDLGRTISSLPFQQEIVRAVSKFC